MPNLRTLALAAVTAAGVTGLAFAAGSAVHVMTVALPGGGVAHIRYTGDVAPKVSFDGAANIAMPVHYWAAPNQNVMAPFAELNRISALMDRQMAAMAMQARMMEQGGSLPMQQALLEGVPPGASQFSMVSAGNGSGFCMRSTQITASPNGGAPKVVTRTSGNCGNAAAQSPSTASPATASPAATNSPSAQTALQTIAYKQTLTSPSPRPRI